VTARPVLEHRGEDRRVIGLVFVHEDLEPA
jgi:hypothetical protein